MDQDKRNFQIGAVVLLTAIAFRLLSNFLPAIPISGDMASVFLFLETGRIVKYSFPSAEEPLPTQPQPQPFTFSAEDAKLVSVNNADQYQVDVAAMLQTDLCWNLTGNAPTVLIVHTHATEGFAETKEQGYHSADRDFNMLSIGAHLTELLESGGIRVIHDQTLHDKPSYSEAYSSSRASIETYLSQYPSICLVLDLHRDSATDAKGNRYAATVTTPLGTSAKLMLVMATDASGKHPNWQENVALGIKLQAVLEKQNPGICRSMLLRTSRYNQDLSTGALLIEVGADGNSHQQALTATEALANAILTLAYGSSV